jgi:hypothetical protein
MERSGFTTEGAEHTERIGNGKAIAMVGWGHLCLPFYAAAQWRCGGGGELRLVMSPGGDGFASAGKPVA